MPTPNASPLPVAELSSTPGVEGMPGKSFTTL